MIDGWDSDTTEFRIKKLEKELQNFREVVDPVLAPPVNIGETGAGLGSNVRTLGPISYPFVFNPVKHRRYTAEPPPGGGANVTNTIFVRSTSIVVTPKTTENPIQIRRLADPIGDGQIAILTPIQGKTMDLLKPSIAGDNINIPNDILGITDDEAVIVQWQVNSPLGAPFNTTGSWVLLGGTAVGGSSSVPDGLIENDHLEWNNTTLVWEPKQVLEFTPTGPWATAGYLRFPNNITAIGWRNSLNTGNITIDVDSNDDLNFNILANDEIIFKQGATPILSVGIISGTKIIDVESSEIRNVNILSSVSANKHIDSVSGGWDYLTNNGTGHNFYVHNLTTFIPVGHFDAGGLNMDDLNISNVSGINFSNTPVSINDGSSHMNLGVATDKEFIFTSGGSTVLRMGELTGQATINVNSSEIINFNILRSTTNKAIDSVSGGWEYRTANATEHQFQVRNAGDTAFVNVGRFNGGGFNADGLPIQGIFSLSFTNAGVAISQTATDMTLGVPTSAVFNYNIAGITEYTMSSTSMGFAGNNMLDLGSIRFNEITDPTAVANSVFLYGKEDGDGITKLFSRWSDGTIVGPLGGGAGGSSDKIFEGDSSVEVIDTGTGVINYTVDSVLTASMIVSITNFFTDVRVAGDLEPSTGSTFILGSTTLPWSLLYADRWRMRNDGGVFTEIFSDGTQMVFNVPTGDGYEWRINGVVVLDIASDGTLSLTGENLTGVNNLTVTGTSTLALTNISGTATFTGIASFNGSVTSLNSATIVLGDATSDNLSISAQVTTNFVPDVNNSFDLGTSSLRWNDIFLGGALNHASTGTVGFYGVAPVTRQVAGGFSGAGDTLQQLKDKYNATRASLITTGLLSA